MPKRRPLLTTDDPPPVVLVNAKGHASPVVLTCEHGGRAVPAALASGTPPPADMERHIAYDVGAAEVAAIVAERLGAPLALQPYSRLVIDCNRPRHAPDLAPAISDGSAIPFNQSLEGHALEARWQAIHQPFHRAITGLIDARGRPALLAVHSFTRQMRRQAASAHGDRPSLPPGQNLRQSAEGRDRHDPGRSRDRLRRTLSDRRRFGLHDPHPRRGPAVCRICCWRLETTSSPTGRASRPWPICCRGRLPKSSRPTRMARTPSS